MKAKQYKKYSDVPKQYQWDLEDILQNKPLTYWIDLSVEIAKKRISNKDSKYKTIEAYLEDIKDANLASEVENKISNYLSNKLNVNLIDPEIKKLSQDYEFLSQQLSDEFGSELNRFYANMDKMLIYKEDPRLKNHKRYIEELIENKKHKLSDEVEEYLIQSAIGEPDPHAIFSVLTNSELDYGYVEFKNKKVKLNPTNRSQFLKSDDSNVRKQAYQNYWNAYYKHKDSLSELLFQEFQRTATHAKLTKYDSATQMLTSSDKVSDQVLQTLFKQVSENRKVLLKYRKYYNKFYLAKFKSKMKKWDTQRELVKTKAQYSVEEAKQLVLDAIQPFGSEYINQVQKAFNENWIDFMSVVNKRSGAYSIGGTYGIDKKYILMNFDGELGSVETLAHELGHSMHSYFSDKNQPIELSQYPIFLAEIASIFNELMLFDNLLKTSNDKKLKFKILTNMIDGFVGTVLRQVQWANYEYDLYHAIAKGKISSSYDAISKLYFENSKKYSLSKLNKYVAKDNLGSIYVPHYYYGFYVYKYAIGQLVANYFFADYQKRGKEALDNYIKNFLSQGSSDYPIEILKKVGVDLEDNNFYTQGFAYLSDLIDQWVVLGKEIFKTK
ncbi:oligoendopeptidase F [Mycoplasma nasistruthionis]|uniref:Oligopeptidase F n=1 Tax=Mycoplasma nasistruthionis TaxID=353852 RepID=A0A5B7XUU0_9MOLU|nr:oligoendopeptidase F [Mycoplasma nasistruthionis]QCZ36462.1 oligoendopeptidase F [Mycoplasma nasistruthionis]